MAERRKPASLLDFAIAASIAVVPVLLGVVLLVAVIRPADADASGPRPAASATSACATSRRCKTFEPRDRAAQRDQRAACPMAPAGARRRCPQCRREWRGASRVARLAAPRSAWRARRAPPPAEQIAAQLRGFDAALLALQQPRQRRGSSIRSASMPARWFAAASAALATPIENPDAPGQPFRLRCADLADALAALRARRRGDARQPGLARQRERGSRWRAGAATQEMRDPGAPGDAAQPLERRRRLHLPRRRGRRRRARRARTFSRRRAARSGGSARLPELARARCGGERARRPPARPRRSPTVLAGEPGLADRARRHALDGAAVAAGDAAAARVAASADRRALPRCRPTASSPASADADGPRAAPTGSSSTAAASTSASRST